MGHHGGVRTITRFWRALRAGDDGASAVEYGLLVAGLVVGAIALVFAFIGVARAIYESDCDTVGQYGISTAPQGCP